jgi:hypothetical protein
MSKTEQAAIETRDGPVYWHDVPGFDPGTHDYSQELPEGALCTCGDMMDTAETGQPWRDRHGVIHEFSGQVKTYEQRQREQAGPLS